MCHSVKLVVRKSVKTRRDRDRGHLGRGRAGGASARMRRSSGTADLRRRSNCELSANAGAQRAARAGTGRPGRGPQFQRAAERRGTDEPPPPGAPEPPPPAAPTAAGRCRAAVAAGAAAADAPGHPRSVQRGAAAPAAGRTSPPPRAGGTTVDLPSDAATGDPPAHNSQLAAGTSGLRRRWRAVRISRVLGRLAGRRAPTTASPPCRVGLQDSS